MAMRGLIEGTIVGSGENRGELRADLLWDFRTCLEWIGNGAGKSGTRGPPPGSPFSAETGTRFSRDGHLIEIPV